MKPWKKHSIWWLMILMAVVVGCTSAEVGRKEPSASGLEITLLFFNDLHGHLMPFKAKTERGRAEVGGIARMAALVERIRAENEARGAKTYLLLAGDILQGTPMSTTFQGEPDIESLNAMGVDVMTVGNHEFDFGLDNFLKLKKKATFPFISSNIVWKDTGERLCSPYASFRLSETVSLTVVGTTTDLLLTTTLPDNVARLDILDPVSTVRKIVGEAEGRGPVVLLSHSRHRTDRRIALALPELTAVIGGHDQILLDPYRKIGNVPVFQAFEKGRYLGRLDLKIDPESGTTELLSHDYLPVTAEIEPDAEVDGIVRAWYARLGKSFKQVIGQSEVFFDGERERIRYQETNLGDFVTDVMREYTGAQIALLNGGSLRASLEEGPVLLEQVFKVMPFSNEIVLVNLTGRELLTALSRSVIGTRADEDGGFLHVSGLRFVIRGRSVEEVRIGPSRQPLDPDVVYRVAVTDFLASGGDGYRIFVGKPAEYTGSPLRELIVDTIRHRGAISGRTDGRIKRLSTTP